MKSNRTQKGRSITDDQKNCRNPFHFLKRHFNLSSQRITSCPCSNFPCKSAGVSQDIRLFLLPESNSTMTNIATSLLTFSNHHIYNTREDLIRGGKIASFHSTLS